jgi:hypothetical protein
MADKKKEAKIIALPKETAENRMKEQSSLLLWSFNMLKEIDELSNQYWDLDEMVQ